MARKPKPAYKEPNYRDTITPDLIERIESGRSLWDVCKDSDMPHVNTIYEWMADDPAYKAKITRARETGYHERAERAVVAAKDATDAGLGRLALDAEKWFLSKVSKAFADKVVIGGDQDNPIVTRQYDMTKLSIAQLEALEKLGLNVGTSGTE